MSLELLCGPANSGKVRVVVDRVIEGCREAGGAWLVVPTAADIRRARSELVERAGVLLGVRVGTFHHLVRELAGEAVDEPLGAPAELVLVRRLLEGNQAFRPSLRYPGFVRTARRLLVELRSAQAAGDAALRERLSLLPIAEQRAWRDVLAAWEGAIASLGARDDAWFERAALRRVLSGEGGSLVPIHAYGFDDLDEMQVRLLLAAARHVPVSLSLPFVRGRLVFERRQALVDRLSAAGARVADHGEPAIGSTTLGELEARFYEPTADPVGADADSVRFIEVCGDLQEAECVVREVGRLIRQGVEPGAIACLTADPAGSRALLEAAFRRAGVPAVFEVPRQLADTPAGRALLQALDAAITGDPTALVAFARSRVSPVERSLVDQWELASVARRHACRPGREGLVGLWQGLEWVPQPLRRMARLEPDSRDPRALEAVHALLRTMTAAAAGDVRLLGAVEQLVDTLRAACGPVAPSLQELRDAIAAMPIPAPEERPAGAVVVAPVTRVRTDRFDAVVVWDLHSGGFAASGPDHDHAPLVARELAYIAFTRAWSHASFVRQVSASDGRVRAPHPVWSELRRLLPTAPLERRRLDEVVCAPGRTLFASELRAAAAVAVGEGTASLDGAAPHVVELVPRASTPRDRSVGAELSTVLEAQPTLRVTDVEGYVGCPSRWFVQRHLLPRDAAGPSRRRIIGMLVHAALAELVPPLAGGAQAVPPDAGPIEHAMQAAEAQLPRAAVLRVVDRASARAIVERVVRDERVLGSHSRSEVPFGGASDELVAPVIGGVRLSGRIDRIDIDADGRAVVHDYKLSRTATAGRKLVEEGNLQAPLYWMALDHTPGLTPVGALYRPLEAERPRGLLHKEQAPPVDGEFRTDRLDEGELQELLDEARRAAEQAVAGIRAGQVAPDPRGGACPSWCDLQSICRVEAS